MGVGDGGAGQSVADVLKVVEERLSSFGSGLNEIEVQSVTFNLTIRPAKPLDSVDLKAFAQREAA